MSTEIINKVYPETIEILSDLNGVIPPSLLTTLNVRMFTLFESCEIFDDTCRLSAINFYPL